MGWKNVSSVFDSRTVLVRFRKRGEEADVDGRLPPAKDGGSGA